MLNIETSDRKIPIFKWKRIEKTLGPQPRPRHGHRAVAIKDLMVVFGGGNEGMHDGLHVFNTATEQWYVPPMKGEHSPGRAGFGFVVDNTRIIVFGGMIEYGLYSNDLFELQATKWEWRYLRPRNSSGQHIPCPRLGHSFNIVDKKIFMFGGISKVGTQVRYLNDLFVLDLLSDGSVIWDQPHVFGPNPPARESHSAVVYQDKFGRYKLIVYGGMNGKHRLGDLWTLHLGTMQWTKEIVCGNAPLPRSLHSATVVSQRMFVFGGWVPTINDDKATENFLGNEEWQCSNQLACLNLETMVWEELQVDAPEGNLPRKRAGHSAVAMNSRIYIWSGRDGYNKAWNNQVCCKDLWYLEVEKPESVGRIHLISSSVDFLELSWGKISCVDSYILQIKQFANLPMEKSQNFENLSLCPIPSPPVSLCPNPSQPVSNYTNKSSFVANRSSHVFNTTAPNISKSHLTRPENIPPAVTTQLPTTPRFPGDCFPHSLSTLNCLTSPKLTSPSPSLPHCNISSVQPYYNVMPLQSSQSLNSLQKAPKAIETNPNTKKSLSNPLPIVITVPSALPEEQTPEHVKTPQSSSYTALSKNDSLKPAPSFTILDKPPVCHIPVPCAPVAPYPVVSQFQPTTDFKTKLSLPLPIGFETTHQQQLSDNLLPVFSSATSSMPTNSLATTATTQVRVVGEKFPSSSTMTKYMTAAPAFTSASTSRPITVTSQPGLTRLSQAVHAINTTASGPLKPVTVITSSGKHVRLNIQKLNKPSSNTACMIIPKAPVTIAKENIPKLLPVMQGGAQQKTVYKIVKTSHGPSKNILHFEGTPKHSTIVIGKPLTTASPSFMPGARLITIKRPVTFKMTNDLASSPRSAVDEMLTRPQLFSSVGQLTNQSQPSNGVQKRHSDDSNGIAQDHTAESCQTGVEFSLVNKQDLKRPFEDISDEDSDASVPGKLLKPN